MVRNDNIAACLYWFHIINWNEERVLVTCLMFLLFVCLLGPKFLLMYTFSNDMYIYIVHTCICIYSCTSS